MIAIVPKYLNMNSSNEISTLNESQRLLAQHQLRWEQERIKERGKEIKFDQWKEKERTRISQIRTRLSPYFPIALPPIKQIAEADFNSIANGLEEQQRRARAIEDQRKHHPNEEDSFDRIDPKKLPTRHEIWRWQPSTRAIVVEHPGNCYSARDVVTKLHYKPEHYMWIQESLNMRGWLRVMMGRHRIKNEYTAFDIGNNTYYVL